LQTEEQAAWIEEQVTQSTFLVCILSSFCLQDPSFVFAMECAAKYNMVVLLVHAAETCPFPVCNIPSIQSFFSEKAITFLSDYGYAAAEQIAERVAESKKKRATSHEAAEDIHTRLFLSHKRATAQAIAGRLYEGLKGDYRIFLDSEAQFKIHDLEKIVKQTDVFVFILSRGIFDSVWCLKELRQAIAANKKVVVIRDFSFNLPESYPADLEDVMVVIKNSPTLVWMAEYNSHCLKRLAKEYIGAPDRILAKLSEWLQANNMDKEQLKESIESNHELKLDRWSERLTSIPVALKPDYGIDISKITKISLFECKQMEDEDLKIFKEVPNTEELNLECCFRLTDAGTHTLVKLLPHLRVLNVAACSFTDKGLATLLNHLPNLESISINQCKKISDVTIEAIAQHPKIHSVMMDHLALVSDEGFSKLGAISERLTEISIDGTMAITENGLKIVLAQASSLKKLKFAALHRIHGILADISSYQCHSSLEELYIGWTVDTTYRRHEVVYQLGSFPNLKKLTVPNDYPMDDNSVAHVLKSCPRLQEAEFF